MTTRCSNIGDGDFANALWLPVGSAATPHIPARATIKNSDQRHIRFAAEGGCFSGVFDCIELLPYCAIEVVAWGVIAHLRRTMTHRIRVLASGLVDDRGIAERPNARGLAVAFAFSIEVHSMLEHDFSLNAVSDRALGRAELIQSKCFCDRDR